MALCRRLGMGGRQSISGVHARGAPGAEGGVDSSTRRPSDESVEAKEARVGASRELTTEYVLRGYVVIGCTE